MLEPYIPKSFCKEYAELGLGQLPMFMAVAKGVKPVMDEWVPLKEFENFKKICKKYSLVFEKDLIFIDSKEDKKKIVGGSNINTTFAYGKRFTKEQSIGTVHLFISKSKELAIQAKKFGWYPVVINNRTINKPFVDHLRFGECLGFPKCCIDFFRKFNNWHLYSHPYEAFKNTPKIGGKARGSYYCNNFLMDNCSYFYSHHIPCSFRCEKTIEYAKKIEDKIGEEEPAYVKKIIEYLKKPLLVFGERNFIIFDGEIKDGEIRYKDFQYFKNPARMEDTIDFFNFVKNGNRIFFKKDKIFIMKNDDLLKKINKKKEWFMIDFD